MTSIIVKHTDNHRSSELFNKSKLQKSILMACLNVKTPTGYAHDIATKVASGVSSWLETRPEVSSDDIRRQASRLLTPLNPDAAHLYKHHNTIL